MKTLAIFLFLFTISAGLFAQTAEEYYNRGRDKSELKDYKGAIVDYTKAIELNPNYTHAYYNRGWDKYELRDYRGAILDYSKAVELNSEYSEAYYNRGWNK